MSSKKGLGERTAYIVVDCLTSFSLHLGDTNKTYEIETYNEELCLTMWPFVRTPIREDSSIGKDMVALYEKHFDGYGQIRRWNYVKKNQGEKS